MAGSRGKLKVEHRTPNNQVTNSLVVSPSLVCVQLWPCHCRLSGTGNMLRMQLGARSRLLGSRHKPAPAPAGRLGLGVPDTLSFSPAG